MALRSPDERFIRLMAWGRYTSRAGPFQLLLGPCPAQTDQFLDRWQVARRPDQVERPPCGLGIQGEAADGAGHVVHRDQVDPLVAGERYHTQPAGEVEAERIVQGVEGPDVAVIGTAHYHPGAEHRYRKVDRIPDQHLALVLALLIVAEEAVLVGQVIFRDRTLPPACHVGGGDMG